MSHPDPSKTYYDPLPSRMKSRRNLAMKTRKAERQYCQWHETMETRAECSMKPTLNNCDENCVSLEMQGFTCDHHQPIPAVHTPTPWRVNDKRLKHDVIGNYLEGLTIENISEDTNVAEICGGINTVEARANAAFIVRACNAFDAMLIALKAARITLGDDELYAECKETYETIDKAIKQAEGNTHAENQGGL